MKEEENRVVVECEFRFKCPQDWHALALTADERVRYCEICCRNVRLCRNEDEYLFHAAAGHCVAVLAHSETGEGVFVLGIPETPYSER